MPRNINKYLAWNQLISFHRWTNSSNLKGPHFDHYNCRIGANPEKLLLNVPSEILARIMHFYLDELEHTGQKVRILWRFLTSSSHLYRLTLASNVNFWWCMAEHLYLDYNRRVMSKTNPRETVLIHARHSCTICGCGGVNRFVPELKAILCLFCRSKCLISLSDLNNHYDISFISIKDLPHIVRRRKEKTAEGQNRERWVKYYIPSDVEQQLGKKLKPVALRL